MSKVQEYLAKKALDKKIKEEKLPIMYVVRSNSQGVQPMVEMQVTEIKKSIATRTYYDNFSSVPIHRYIMGINKYPFSIDIEEGKVSGTEGSDYYGDKYYCTLDKNDAEKYVEQEMLRIDEKYNPSGKLFDGKFYWIQCWKDAEWEIARYRESDGRMHMTNGSYIAAKDVYEIDKLPIEPGSHHNIFPIG